MLYDIWYKHGVKNDVFRLSNKLIQKLVQVSFNVILMS